MWTNFLCYYIAYYYLNYYINVDKSNIHIYISICIYLNEN